MARLEREYDLLVEWLAFPLHPETPEEGQTLERLFAGRGKDIPAMLERLGQVAQAEGLPWGQRSMTFNSRRAQELGKWAQEQGRGEAFHQAAFRAYFVEGLNLARLEVLRGLAAQVGLDPDLAQEALASGRYAPAVDQDWALSRSLGISAVPTFVAGSRGLVGAQPHAELERLVIAAGARRRQGQEPRLS